MSMTFDSLQLPMNKKNKMKRLRLIDKDKIEVNQLLEDSEFRPPTEQRFESKHDLLGM